MQSPTAWNRCSHLPTRNAQKKRPLEGPLRLASAATLCCLFLQGAFLAVRELHVELVLDVRFGGGACLTVGYDRIGNDADVLPVLVLLGPVDSIEAREPLRPFLVLHQFGPQSAKGAQHRRMRGDFSGAKL